MEAPIKAPPVIPVRTLAPSQRRLTSFRSTSAASAPLALSGGSCPRSIPDVLRVPEKDSLRPAESMSDRFVFIAYAGSKKGACRPRVGLTSNDHARLGLENQRGFGESVHDGAWREKRRRPGSA